MRVRQLALASLLAVVFAVSAQTSRAATATAPMLISATVLSVCTIVATPLPFLNYTPSTAQAATATISVTCTAGTGFNVGLDAGTTSGSTVTNRRMTNGSSLLNYKLTSDAAHTINIGQTVNTDTLSGTGTGLVQTLTVYGQIPAGQYVAPGAYTDTVTATITY